MDRDNNILSLFVMTDRWLKSLSFFLLLENREENKAVGSRLLVLPSFLSEFRDLVLFQDEDKNREQDERDVDEDLLLFQLLAFEIFGSCYHQYLECTYTTR